jgi:hypothetical protein
VTAETEFTDIVPEVAKNVTPLDTWATLEVVETEMIIESVILVYAGNYKLFIRI